MIGLGFGLNVQVPCFLADPGFELFGVASSSIDSARKSVGQLPLSAPVFSWETLVQHDDVDAICVAVPPGFQRQIVCRALMHGKHVLCEKPLGLNVLQAEEMYDAARDSGLVNAVDFQFRMEPGLRMLRDAIKRGRIGQVKRIDVRWITGGRASENLPWSWQYDIHSGGGTLNAFASHVIDYLQWMCSSPVDCINGARLDTMKPYRIDGGMKKRVTAEDTCDFLLTLKNHIVCNVCISNTILNGCGHCIDIHGSDGRLAYNHEKPYLQNTVPNVWLKRGQADSIKLTEAQSGDRMDEITDSRQGAFSGLARAFWDKINGGNPEDLPDFKKGVSTQKVISAIRTQANACCLIGA